MLNTALKIEPNGDGGATVSAIALAHLTDTKAAALRHARHRRVRARCRAAAGSRARWR